MASASGRTPDGDMALVLSAPFDDAGTTACFDHLTAGDDPPRRVLNVLFTRRPEHRIEDWRHAVGELPETFVVLTSQEPADPPEGTTVEVLEDPGNLTATGVTITEYLGGWPSDGRTGFCLDSVTAQLQYAGREAVYQFLHTLRGHLVEREAVGHVHLNPNAHDEETVDTIKTLFDSVVPVEGDGPDVPTS